MHTLGLKSRTEGRVWAEKLEASFLDCSLTPRDFGQDSHLVYSSVKWGELPGILPSQGLHVAHKHLLAPFLLVLPPQSSFKNQNCSNENPTVHVSLKRETGTTGLIL